MSMILIIRERQSRNISALAANELFILINRNGNLRAHVRTDCTPCTLRRFHRARNKIPYLVKLLCHGNNLHRAGLNAVAAAFA